MIPLAVRLAGALDRSALERALADLLARHESLRTVFPETLGVARQQVLAADGFGRGAGGFGEPARRSLPARCRLRPAAGLIFRAICRCGRICLRCRSMSMCCCWRCITSPATAGRLVRCCVTLGCSTARGGMGLRRSLRRCRCNTPTTRCGSAPCWARRRDPDSAMARQLSYWTERLSGLPDQLDLAERPAAACGAEPWRGQRFVCDRGCASPGAAGACAAERGQPVHGAAGRACRRC